MISSFLREYETDKNPMPKQWNEFVSMIFQIIYTIDGHIQIINNFTEFSDLCLNLDRSDEWRIIPLNTKIYIIDIFFNLGQNPHSPDIPSVTSTINFNVTNRTKFITNIEKKYRYLYEKRLPPDYTSFMNMVKTEKYIKRCANCGKYFIPLKRSDTLYCDRPAPQDNTKTCKRYGGEKQYHANLKKSETANRYRQVYMRLQMLVKRNPTYLNI